MNLRRLMQHVSKQYWLDFERYIWAECSELTSDSGHKLVSCDSPVDAARAGEILARIRTDQGLMDNILYWLSAADIARNIARSRSPVVTDQRAVVVAEMTRESNVGPRCSRAPGIWQFVIQV